MILMYNKSKIKKGRILVLILIGSMILICTTVGSKLSLDGKSEITQNSKEVKTSSASGINYEFKWEKTWDKTSSDVGYDVAVDNESNILVYGQTSEPKAVLIKYDSVGTMIWNSTWDKKINNLNCKGLAVYNDSIYITGYYSESGVYKIFLVKYYPNGTTEWETFWGYDMDHFASDIAVDSKGDVYIVGNNQTGIPSDIAVYKFYSNGTSAWNVTRDGLWGEPDSGYCIAVDKNDNIYVSGTSFESLPTPSNIITLKYSSLGAFQWERYWNGSQESEAKGIATDYNNNIYVVGFTNESEDKQIHNDQEAILLKYNSDGDLIFERIWGAHNRDDLFTGVVIIGEQLFCIGKSGLVWIGTENWKFALVEYTIHGLILGQLEIEGSNDTPIYLENRIAADGNASLYFVDSKKESGDEDILLIKIGPTATQPCNIYYIIEDDDDDDDDEEADILVPVIVTVGIISAVGVACVLIILYKKGSLSGR